MLCPHCTSNMQEMAKVGVFIDVCPECKGVWLDRGELDKILNRIRELGREEEEDSERFARHARHEDDDEESRHTMTRQHSRKRRWSDIFDIFD